MKHSHVKSILKNIEVIEKDIAKHKEYPNIENNNSINRFDLRRNTEKDWCNKNSFQNRNVNMMSFCNNNQRVMLNELKMQSDHLKIQLNLFMQAQNSLDSAPKRVNESNQTFRNFGSEVTSTDSTPRIAEEDIKISDAKWGDCESSMKHFHDINMFRKRTYL